MEVGKPCQVWGVLWRSRNKLDGAREHLVRRDCVPALFRTRREAREFIDREYGYIRKRQDLRAEPHGWKVPVAVKVTVTVTVMV